jgi:flavin-dependent dehydrogenase
LIKCDVAIIGGGPAGATAGSLLKKYNPSLDVVILERERFPRDHVGESLLPAVTSILNEMGVWDAIEAADFPIKLGAIYRWGKKSENELYHFHFLRGGRFSETARPGQFQGERRSTTFQVDRSIYDKILLEHAAEIGCKVFEQTRVVEVERLGDSVTGLRAVGPEGVGQRVEARWYFDASGVESIVRKSFDIGIESPTRLRNIAIWDYWTNAEWAQKIGVGGTYVYVMSLGYGWIWFIPLGPTRTSIGFVTSANRYKETGKTTEELYLEAIEKEPLIRSLVQNATRENRLEATKDWSFVADRLYGENWFLVGDAGGFADPILASGLTLAQTAARRAAYSVLEIDRGGVDSDWIRSQFDRVQRRNIKNHIRFADYWYSANELFTDLKDYCSEIARDSGLTLDPDEAFQWLGTGGFADELNGQPFAGTTTVTAIKSLTSWFSDKSTQWQVFDNNLFSMNLEGAIEERLALYSEGRVLQLDCWRRGDQVWPLNGFYHCIYKAFLSGEREIELLAERFIFELRKAKIPQTDDTARVCLEALEALVTEGWVSASYDPTLPLLDVGREKHSA